MVMKVTPYSLKPQDRSHTIRLLEEWFSSSADNAVSILCARRSLENADCIVHLWDSWKCNFYVSSYSVVDWLWDFNCILTNLGVRESRSYSYLFSRFINSFPTRTNQKRSPRDQELEPRHQMQFGIPRKCLLWRGFYTLPPPYMGYSWHIVSLANKDKINEKFFYLYKKRIQLKISLLKR